MTLPVDLPDLAVALFGVAVLVFGTARVSRVVAHDDFPPAEWLRIRAYALLGDRWGKVADCIWCAQPYIVAISLAWGLLSGFHWSWWVFWGWMAVSQAGSIVLEYDEAP